ncbi:MAG TPA: DUF3107 domain-containing protein [Streptosporangiaceae bacterium]|nr:DUF3107 domain-containing protein [Streptosporangiaceae bacterium]
MEVKIGIQMAPRELVVETTASPEDIQRALTTALADGTVFVVTDARRGTVMVPADKIAYVELDLNEPRRIGFGS